MGGGWDGLPVVQWIAGNETVLLWLTAASLVTFVATLIAVPWWLERVPADYFTHARRQRKAAAVRHPVIRALEMIGKNLLGLFFLLTGIVMLILPGQGLLTILAGVLLLNFPGKRRLEAWIISRGIVLQSINWLRQRKGHPPLVLDK